MCWSMRHTASYKKKGCAEPPPPLAPDSLPVPTLCLWPHSSLRRPSLEGAGVIIHLSEPRMMCGDGGSTRQRYVILSFRIGSMDSTGTEHCSRSFLTLSDAGYK